jgi:hypothetical protein
MRKFIFKIIVALSLNSLLPGSIKLKQNAENHRKRPASFWGYLDLHNMHRQRTSVCHLPA